MPGKNSSAEAMPASAEASHDLASALKEHVGYLANTVGPRNFTCPKGLKDSAEYVRNKLSGYGYSPVTTSYKADPKLFSGYGVYSKMTDIEYEIVAAEIRGSVRPEKIIVVGAHYDSVALDGCRAADDNASGVAGVLELARMFSMKKTEGTLRFVCFPNEEPPFFQTSSMGSWQYAKACHDRGEDVVGMLSLETIGYFSDQPGSQNYPYPLNMLYPDKGNFIGFVGNVSSASLVRECVDIFRRNSAFPCEGAALFGGITGVGWSDHWSFWEMGYPALMVTDTATFRYPHYHTPSDNPDRLDYVKMAQVIKGLEEVLKNLSASE